MVNLSHIFIDFTVEQGSELHDLIIGGITAFADEHPQWLVTEIDAIPAQGRQVTGGIVSWGWSRGKDALYGSYRLPVVNLFDFWPKCALNLLLDNTEAGAMAAQHLIDQGLRHFAYVGCPDWFWSVEREAGFAARLAAEGHAYAALNPPLDRHVDSRQRLIGFYAKTAEWLLTLPKPVGVFCCHDTTAHRVLNACLMISARIPNEIAILGVNDSSVHCKSTQPHLSSVAFPWEEIGYTAAQWVDRFVKGEAPPGDGTLKIPPTGVHTRQSTDFTAAEAPEIAGALQFIRANACKPISVTDVAQAAHVNRRRLEVLFRTRLSRTPLDEIRRVQIENAKRLLSHTDLLVSVVAERSGLSAQRFHSVFREETGLTPRAYRLRFHVSSARRRPL